MSTASSCSSVTSSRECLRISSPHPAQRLAVALARGTRRQKGWPCGVDEKVAAEACDMCMFVILPKDTAAPRKKYPRPQKTWATRPGKEFYNTTPSAKRIWNPRTFPTHFSLEESHFARDAVCQPLAAWGLLFAEQHPAPAKAGACGCSCLHHRAAAHAARTASHCVIQTPRPITAHEGWPS